MQHDDLFNKLKQNLYQAALKYEKLLDKTIIFKSEEFINQKQYKAKFYKENFLHLTGIKTILSPSDFFVRCLSKDIKLTDILNFPKEYKSKICSKVKSLQYLDTYFNNSLFVEENFQKNSIICVLATSNGYITLGFVKTKPIIRPMTLLNKNLLSDSIKILKIRPKILK